MKMHKPIDVGASVDRRRAQEPNMDAAVASTKEAMQSLARVIEGMQSAGMASIVSELAGVMSALDASAWRMNSICNTWLREAPKHTGGWPGAYLPGDR